MNKDFLYFLFTITYSLFPIFAGMEQDLNAFKIVDKSYKAKHAHRYHLNVSLREGGMGYSVYDPVQRLFVALANYEGPGRFAYESLLTGDELMSESYAIIRVMVSSKDHTLIPNEFYSQSQLVAYAETHFSKAAGKVLVNDLVALNAKQVFKLDPAEQQIITKHFIGASIYHEGTALLEGLLREGQEADKKVIYFQVNKQNLQLVVFDNGTLKLYNTYSYSTDQEFIYYPLFVCDKLGLMPRDFRTFMLGDIQSQDDNYMQLHRHFNNVQFGGLSGLFHFGAALQGIPQHRFYTLFNIELCA